MNYKSMFKYKWRLFLLLIVIPTFFVGLMHENISRKDAQLNGEVVDVKIKSISCRSKKGSTIWVVYNDNTYTIEWNCKRDNGSEGDIIKVKYSKKYDVMVRLNYRHSQGFAIFFYIVVILLFIYIARDTYKKIRSG